MSKIKIAILAENDVWPKWYIIYFFGKFFFQKKRKIWYNFRMAVPCKLLEAISKLLLFRFINKALSYMASCDSSKHLICTAGTPSQVIHWIPDKEIIEIYSSPWNKSWFGISSSSPCHILVSSHVEGFCWVWYVLTKNDIENGC